MSFLIVLAKASHGSQGMLASPSVALGVDEERGTEEINVRVSSSRPMGVPKTSLIGQERLV